MESIQKKLVLMTFSAFLLLFAACSDSVQTEPTQPNILFLFADDQRADTLSAWGNPHIRTPNIDGLVESGFSFRLNYNLGGNSGAVCVPSRAMVNSGKAYFRIQNDLTDTRILPEILKENGYMTFATGKWHNQKPSWLRGFQKGRNIFFGGMSDHTKVPLFDLSPEGELINERIGDGFSSEMFADAVIEFINSYQEDRPFYAYVPFTAPHDPRQPPPRFREPYYESRPPLPENFLPQHPFSLGKWLTIRDEVLAGWPRREDVIGSQLAEYYGMVTHLDEQVGRILANLKNSKHAENTIVIYAADHGLAMGSHGLLGKQNVYEHSQRCPLIFFGPGIPQGESMALTYLHDIFPTVMSLTGLESPNDLDGTDLSVILEGKSSSVRDSLFLSFTDHMRSVRDTRYKLIRYPRINHTQLFDLQSDPIEMVNLAEKPEHSSRVEEMSGRMLKWQRQLGDDLPLSVDDPLPMEIDLSGIERKPDRWQPEWIVEKYFKVQNR